MTVEKACGYIREALEEMGFCPVFEDGEWRSDSRINMVALEIQAVLLLQALDSLDPMGTTCKEEG